MMDSRKNKLLVLFVIIIGVGCLFLLSARNMTFAKAGLAADSGVYDSIKVVPIQIGRDSYGIAMVDTVGHNLWIYEVNSRGSAQNCLRLIAARSFEYDRLLEQFNTAEPLPETVKKLLSDLQEGDKKSDKPAQDDIDKKEPNKSAL